MDLFQATAMQGKDGDRMNKAFEMIFEKLEELQNNLLSQTEGDVSVQVGIINGVMYSKKIVQEVAEEYNGGWIACSERLPEERDWCLAVFEEVDTGFIGLPYIAEYLMGKHTKFTTEDGWIIHNCSDREDESAEYYKNLRCVAWQQLPEPYKENGANER